jgi:hypothetical protein
LVALVALVARSALGCASGSTRAEVHQAWRSAVDPLVGGDKRDVAEALGEPMARGWCDGVDTWQYGQSYERGRRASVFLFFDADHLAAWTVRFSSLWARSVRPAVPRVQPIECPIPDP